MSWNIPETLGWGGWDRVRQIPRAGGHESRVGWWALGSVKGTPDLNLWPPYTYTHVCMRVLTQTYTIHSHARTQNLLNAKIAFLKVKCYGSPVSNINLTRPRSQVTEHSPQRWLLEMLWKRFWVKWLIELNFPDDKVQMTYPVNRLHLPGSALNFSR